MHFRSGEKHSNHGNDAKEAVVRIPVYSAPDSAAIRHPDPERSDASV
jgi:hypothetical protein